MEEATHLPLCAGYNWVLTAMAGSIKKAALCVLYEKLKGNFASSIFYFFSQIIFGHL